MPADPARHLVVIGPMGVGKTTTAAALARRLGRPLADSDADIEALTGGTGRALAAAEGVSALHDLEAAVLLGALARAEPTVIAAAASTVERPVVRRALGRRAVVIRLDADAAEIRRRQGAGGHRRPMGAAEFDALARRREPMLAEVTDLRVDASRPPDEVVAQIIASLPDAAGPG